MLRESAVRRRPTRRGRSRSWSRRSRGRSGRGTSPSCAARPAGCTTTCTSCSTSSPGTSSRWTIAAREDSDLAKEMLEEAMGTHGVPDVVHADRGTSMTSKPVAQLLVDLGVTRSHSRPRVSNDNPYSEAAFKTLKYAPGLPRDLRLAGRRPRVRRGVLRLLQPRAPPLRDRAAHPGLGPLRHRPRRPGAAPGRPSTPPTQPDPNGSATADPNRRNCPPRPGSTSPHERRSYRAPDRPAVSSALTGSVTLTLFAMVGRGVPARPRADM